MRRYHLIMLATMSLASVRGATQDVSEQQRFAGTWQARHQGALICTIRLTAGVQLAGAFYGCSFEVNQDGDLLESEFDGNPNDPSPVQNLAVQVDRLSFEVKDGDDVMRFELVLTGEGQAELRFLETPVKIKPIHFERQA